ncbi:MAG: helix-turn-helix domain-containing protein [Bacillota bacterium]
MAVSYKKLFHLLVDRDMSPADLMREAGFSGNIIMRLRRNEYISLQSIESICRVLNCGPQDVVDFLNQDKKTE